MSTIDPSTTTVENPYGALGEIEGCRKLATAFYARVERDPVLRPLFPSTFKCAIEQCAMFLAEFLGGPSQHTATRWSMSLVDMHERLKIGPKEREHRLERVIQAIADVKIAEPARGALQQLFAAAFAYMVHRPHAPQPPATPFHEDLAKRWDAQRTLEDAAAAIRRGDAAQAAAQAGANVDAHNGVKRCTVLHMAARRGYVPVAAALVDRRANIEARDRAGDTPLRRAVNCRKAEVAEFLLSRGADPHSLGSRGLTPLRAGRGATMQQLLRSYI